MKLSELLISVTENYIAVNKPSGLLSIPDREGKEVSLKQLLMEQFPSVFTVHRLDKDTSGLIVFARNTETHRHLSAQFENRQTRKIYRGLVIGCPAERSGTIDAPIAEHSAGNGQMIVHRRGKESITEYEVLEELGPYSLVQFRILTGRTHQIRVHAKEIGHPIVADPLYGDGQPVLLSALKQKKFKLSRNEWEERPLLNRLALHSCLLSFTMPDGSAVELEAPLSKDLRATIQQLEKWAVKKKKS